jgi:YD repeat-containing protein
MVRPVVPRGCSKSGTEALFGRSRVRRTRERSWQPVFPSRKTQFRYDRFNRVTEIANARQEITRFAHDPTGNQITFGRTGTLTTITDSVGRTSQFSYLNGRITEILDSLGRRVTYAYDNNGRLATVLDPEGGTTRYTYDAQGVPSACPIGDFGSTRQ